MKTFCLLILLGLVSLSISAQPVISSFSPLSAPAGSTITITGTGFNTDPAFNFVYFGSVRASMISASATKLQVVVPLGCSYQPILITTNGLTAVSKLSFNLTFAAGMAIQKLPNGTQIILEPAVDFPTDHHPNDIAVADFNGDGKPDVATANNYVTSGMPASLSILKNISTVGSIFFSTRQDLPTGQMTYAIVAGDLDGDGKPDLVSTSIVDQTVSYLRNISTVDSIQFSPKADMAAGSNSVSAIISDIDGDGRPEIVLANYLSNTISIFRNRSTVGNISFDARKNFPTLLAPNSVVAGDFDGDGNTDLALTNEFSNAVSVLRNTSSPGNFSFSTRVDLATGSHPFGISAGDIDQDGLVDILVSNNGSGGSLSILRNISTAGAIRFATKIDYQCGQNVYSVSLGDLNGDGGVDIVLPGNLMVMYQNNSVPGNISLGNVVYSNVISNVNKTALCDLDGDGKTDVAGSLFSSTKITVCRNKDNEPSITDFTPKAAGMGTSVTITGNNLNAVSNVSFGGTPAASFHIDNASQITAVIANGSSGRITLTNAYGSQSLDGFTFTSRPEVASFTPQQAGTDSMVVITGHYLAWTTAISFGAIPAKRFTIINDSTINAEVAAGTSGFITVTSPYGSDSLSGFTYIHPPTILSFSPQLGGIGTKIMITGQNLATTHKITIGGVPASFTLLSNNSIEAVVSDGGYGNIALTSLGGICLAGPFVFPKPTISSFAPDSGYAGLYVTIAGTNFRKDIAGNTVYFGAAMARVISTSTNTLTVQVPPGATYMPLKVITNGYSVSSRKPFSLTFPHDNSGLSVDALRAESAFTSRGQPWQLLLVDLDSDGRSDLLSVNYQESTIAVLPNMTAGGKTAFGAPVIIAGSFGFNTKIRPKAVDIDNDGKLDIIFTCDGLRMTILKNTSTQHNISFAAPISISIDNAIDLVADDFDGDGRKDIAVLTGSFIGSSVHIFKNKSHDGAVQLAPPVIFPTNLFNMMNISAGDIDGDEKADLVIGDNNVSILRNLSDATGIAFATQVDLPNVKAQYLAIGDLDKDGKLDVVTTSGTIENSYSIFRNISTAGLISFDLRKDFTLGDYTSDVQVGDLNGDSKPDMVISMEKGIAVFNNKSDSGNIVFSPPSKYNPKLTYNWVYNHAIGDVDGDGRQDVAVSCGADDKISIFSNHLGDKDIVVCEDKETTITSLIETESYQWQVDTGNGFYDIEDNTHYLGTKSSSLKIFKVPASFNNYRFRCKAGETYTAIHSIRLLSLSITATGPSTFCDGESVTLTSSTSTGNQWFFDGTPIIGATSESFTARKGGLYGVAVTLGNCVVQKDTTVVVLPMLTPSISINYTGCGTGTLNLSADTANAGPGASIQWYVNNNLQGTGSSLSLNKPTAGIEVYANLSIAASCASLGSMNSNTLAINCTITGIPDLNQIQEFKVGPNPTTGLVTVSLKFNHPVKLSFEVIDLKGTQISAPTPVRNVSQTLTEIDLSQKPAGLYMLKIRIDDNIITQKILLVK